MGGEWKFQFNYAKKDSLQIHRYRNFIQQLRQEYGPKFEALNPAECYVEWTNWSPDSTNSTQLPPTNIFARFTYRCVKEHAPQNPDHGTWYLLWDPRQENKRNNLHAKCAPAAFKDLSDIIQKELVEAFPKHFSLQWPNGISGYEFGAINDGFYKPSGTRVISHPLAVQRQPSGAVRSNPPPILWNTYPIGHGIPGAAATTNGFRGPNGVAPTNNLSYAQVRQLYFGRPTVMALGNFGHLDRALTSSAFSSSSGEEGCAHRYPWGYCPHKCGTLGLSSDISF